MVLTVFSAWSLMALNLEREAIKTVVKCKRSRVSVAAIGSKLRDESGNVIGAPCLERLEVVQRLRRHNWHRSARYHLWRHIGGIFFFFFFFNYIIFGFRVWYGSPASISFHIIITKW